MSGLQPHNSPAPQPDLYDLDAFDADAFQKDAEYRQNYMQAWNERAATSSRQMTRQEFLDANPGSSVRYGTIMTPDGRRLKDDSLPWISGSEQGSAGANVPPWLTPGFNFGSNVPGAGDDNNNPNRTNNAAEFQQNYGVSLSPVNTNGKDPSEVFGEITTRQNDIKKRLYEPLEDKIIDTIGDGRMVQAAKDKVATSTGDAEARGLRMASRYGGIQTPLQRQELARKAKLQEATTSASLINDSRLDQNERDTNLRTGLINYYRGVQGSSLQGLSEAAGMQTSRDNQTEMLKAQQKASRTQMIGSAAGMAMFALLAL